MTDPSKESGPATTNDAGNPIASDEYSLSVGPDGPLLLQAELLHGHNDAPSGQPDFFQAEDGIRDSS